MGRRLDNREMIEESRVSVQAREEKLNDLPGRNPGCVNLPKRNAGDRKSFQPIRRVSDLI